MTSEGEVEDEDVFTASICSISKSSFQNSPSFQRWFSQRCLNAIYSEAGHRSLAKRDRSTFDNLASPKAFRHCFLAFLGP